MLQGFYFSYKVHRGSFVTFVLSAEHKYFSPATEHRLCSTCEKLMFFPCGIITPYPLCFLCHCPWFIPFFTTVLTEIAQRNRVLKLLSETGTQKAGSRPLGPSRCACRINPSRIFSSMRNFGGALLLFICFSSFTFLNVLRFLILCVMAILFTAEALRR